MDFTEMEWEIMDWIWKDNIKMIEIMDWIKIVHR
jgi:hypothetical protein